MQNSVINNIIPQINSKQPVLDTNKAKESAESFEAFFLTRMMESIFGDSQISGCFPAGIAA